MNGLSRCVVCVLCGTERWGISQLHKKKDKKKQNVFVSLKTRESRELDPAGHRGRTRGLFNDTKPFTDEDEDIFLGSSSTSAYLCV